MKNWKTTVAGLFTAVIIAVEPIVATGSVDWTKVAIAAGVAVLGYLCPDKKADLNNQTK
jgi:hypothetical protein